jgi:hypothetical protein
MEGSRESLPGPTPESQVNRQPLNQAAKAWLREAGLGIDPELPYLVQLLWEGFQANLSVPGQGSRYWADLQGAAAQLLDSRLDPVDVVRWFVNNPNGGDEKEQSDTLETLLEESASWEEAAQYVMATTGKRRRTRITVSGPPLHENSVTSTH